MKKHIRLIVEYVEVSKDDDDIEARNVRVVLEEDDEELLKKKFPVFVASDSNTVLQSVLEEVVEFVERDFEDGSEGDVEVGDEVDVDPGE